MKKKKFNKEQKDINWKDVETYVRRLQENIFKASQKKDIFEVRKIQKLLLNSTEENTAEKTGI